MTQEGGSRGSLPAFLPEIPPTKGTAATVTQQRGTHFAAGL